MQSQAHSTFKPIIWANRADHWHEIFATSGPARNPCAPSSVNSRAPLEVFRVHSGTASSQRCFCPTVRPGVDDLLRTKSDHAFGHGGEGPTRRAIAKLAKNVLPPADHGPEPRMFVRIRRPSAQTLPWWLPLYSNETSSIRRFPVQVVSRVNSQSSQSLFRLLAPGFVNS